MNIIINGGTRGIGRETAILLSADEANRILVTGRDTGALARLPAASLHGNIITMALDIARFESQADAFLEKVNSCFANVNILINCAGLLVKGDFMELGSYEARLMMETNFFGPALVTRCLATIMPAGSHVVNISSMGGFQGSSKYRGLSYYSASKAALACLSECLALELGDAGISVNCLALGAVQTGMFREAFPGLEAPVTASRMAGFIADFALRGNEFFNGKIIPVTIGNP
jgi:NAD(P)-dependent dehydrogenase (short-subunit alcohol dehydrogenase family)